MYGLPQAGRIAYDELTRHLALSGYRPTTHIPFTHDTQPVSFLLTVDNFGIKYGHARDSNYLLAALRRKYDIFTDWSGYLYYCIT